MSDNLKAGIRFAPDIYAEIGYDSQNESGKMSVIGANGETIWESGEGGGGSSDFSIANVTIITTNGDEKIEIPLCALNLTPEIQGCAMPYVSYYDDIGSHNYKVILFKGKALAAGIIDANGAVTFTNVSGSATMMNPQNVMITGDCTLTVNKVAQP